MTHSMLSNLDRKGKYNAENNEKIKETHEFFKKPSDEEEFEGKIIEDILEPYEHKKKLKNLMFLQRYRMHKQYKIKQKMKRFFEKKFLATTDQKREDYYDKLFDYISNEGDRGQTIDDRINTETYL